MSNQIKISRIKLQNTFYDIEVEKDWSNNNDSEVSYIKNRTHYVQERKGKSINQNESHNFLNQFTNSELVLPDYWCPKSSWIYPGGTYDYQINYTGSDSNTYSVTGDFELKKL